MGSLFLLTRVRGPAWDWSRTMRDQDGWDGHAAFMDALANEGVILLGGPAGEGDGEEFLHAIEAEQEAAVRGRLVGDPWDGGMLTVASLRPWSAWLRGHMAADTGPLFLVLESRGPAWDWSKGRREQRLWNEHAAFMDSLVADGVVVLGGPVGHGDGEKALLVVAAPSEDAIRRRLEDDPWAGHTLAVESIRPWSIWLRAAR